MAIFVGSATSSFLSHSSSAKGVGVGIGTTDTTGRNAGINTARGTLIYNATAQQLQVYDGNQWVGGFTSPFSATGGTESTSSRPGYKVHTFTSPGSLVVNGDSGTVEYLVIAGGGSGGDGSASGGGGGAGALRFNDSFPLTPGTYTIQVGGGGAVSANPGPTAPSYGVGGSGTPSFFGPIVSPGGGGGGGGGSPGAPTRTGVPGGSGGGGGTTFPTPGASSGGTGTGDSSGTGNSNSPSNGWGNDGGGGEHQPNGQGGGGGGGAGSK